MTPTRVMPVCTVERRRLGEFACHLGPFVALIGESFKPQPSGGNHSDFGHGKTPLTAGKTKIATISMLMLVIPF